MSRDSIGYWLGPRADVCQAQIYLMGLVAACWLEGSGRLALHGAAVAIGERALAFLGGNGAGKSTLVHHALTAGAALLSDDLLAVTIDAAALSVAPALAQLRLWPEQMARLGLDPTSGSAVHPSVTKRRIGLAAAGLRFATEAAPLSALLLPHRHDGESAPRLEPIRGAAGAIELVRHATVGPLARYTPWGESHVARIGQLAERLPIFRLHYPSGLHHLPAVYDSLAPLVAK